MAFWLNEDGTFIALEDDSGFVLLDDSATFSQTLTTSVSPTASLTESAHIGQTKALTATQPEVASLATGVNVSAPSPTAPPVTWDPSPVIQDIGTLQVVLVDSLGRKTDITYYNGVPIHVVSITSNQPFGHASAVFELISLSPYIAPDVLFKNMPDVNINIVSPTNVVTSIFEGFVASIDYVFSETDFRAQIHCMGALYQYDFFISPPPLILRIEPIDVIVAIRNELNRRVTRCRDVQVPSGFSTAHGKPVINTLKQGSGQPILSGYVQDLLSTACNPDGSQWTLDLDPGRQPVVRLKDRTTANWSITVGSPGASHNLSFDYSSQVNAIYGDGIDPGGCHWRNAKYPNAVVGSIPTWPGQYLTHATIPPGGTTGANVVAWEQRMHDSGFDITVDGIYGRDDETMCRQFQLFAGILADGIVGPQTWNATWQQGVNTSDLAAPFYMPVVWDPKTEPYIYDTTGAIIGPNSNYYDPHRIRIERWENFGTNISKAQGTQFARTEYNRSNPPGWMGTITLRSDPDEGSRWFIRPGQNILYRSFAGGEVVEITCQGINSQVMGMGLDATNLGYWLVLANGGVFSFGDAGFHGSEGGKQLNQQMTGMYPTASGNGYWLVAGDGGVFAFGDATFYGSLPGLSLVPDAPIVGIAATPTENGYWLAGADGGVFAFGDAGFHGNEVGGILAPIVDIESAPTGNGYWLVAADGAIYAHGTGAGFHGGQNTGPPLNAPITGMARTVSGGGYWLVAADGGVFAHGDAPFHGSLVDGQSRGAIVGIAPTTAAGFENTGYWLTSADGETFYLGTIPKKQLGGVLFHVSQVEKNFDDFTVTLTVDEHARDLMTLQSIYMRNQAANDPSLRPQPYHMGSVQVQDFKPIWDCESGAGIIPRTGLQAGLWHIIRFPAAGWGTVVGATFSTDDPAQFSIGVFDREITANWLQGIGNPLTTSQYWTFVEQAGINVYGGQDPLIIAWGDADQLAGYSPGTASNGDPITGVLQDNGSWYYQSSQPPWLWAAIYCDTTTFIEGRFLPGLVEN